MPWIPFVKTGYLGTNQWVPLVNGNGLTAGGGEPVPEIVWVKVTGTSPLSLPGAIANSIKSLTQYGLCTQATTPTPDAPVDIMCNNGVLTKPHDTYTAVDGQGTYVSPGAAANRIYKAFNVGDGNYTISVPTAYDFIVQYKTPTDGSTPTGSGNITSWVNGYTTVTLDKGTAYGYGIALRDHVNQSGSISPADFSGTIVVVHDDEPVKAVGTPEVLNVGLDEWAVYETGYLNASGGVASNANYGVTDYLPTEAGEKWLFGVTFTAAVQGAGLRYCFYDSTKTLIGERQGGDTPSAGVYNFEATAPSGAAFVRVSNNIQNSAKNQLVIREPQTVTDVPMLLSVGDYADEAEIISGLLTHKVGIKVLDGTETWTTDTYGGSRRMVSQYIYNASGSTLAVVCSHYIFRPAGEREQPNSIFVAGSGKIVVYVDSTQSISTVDEWTAWLAEQYAAGTPVIVLYPLATPTTDSVTAQPLHTSAGDNTVSVTANVSPVALECEYANGYAQ